MIRGILILNQMCTQGRVTAMYPMKRAIENVPKYVPKLPWIKTFRKPRVSFRLPPITRPTSFPHHILTVGMMLFAVLLMAGAIYDLSERPIPMGFTAAQRPILLQPDLNGQFLIESLVAATFFGIGALGIILIRYSAAMEESARSTTSVLVVGISLIAIATFAGSLMLADKGVETLLSL
ncbi:MAG: hypothetical protein ACFFCQ_00905 [Promethearchaeota archaeon]